MMLSCEDSKTSQNEKPSSTSSEVSRNLSSSAPSSTSTRTGLTIQNKTKDSVTVAVVLAALGGGCPASNPPVTAHQLDSLGFCGNVIESGNPPYAGKCNFKLAPGASRDFPDIPNTCISGNVTFGDYPACPDKVYKSGYSTAEFTLNPTQGAEAVDISLVNGMNYQVNMYMSGGNGTWDYGTTNTPIDSIIPKPLGQNTGNPGVYPMNCTDCIQLVGSSVCPNFPKNPTCQPSRICNAQRSFADAGGTILITAN